MAKEGALQQFVRELTVGELARLSGLELDQIVHRLGIGSDPPAVARKRSGEPPPCAVSPAQLVARLERIADLSPRHTEVARLLLLGEPDRAIADRLGCSERTAKRQVADVLSRCGASNRSSLMRVIFQDAGTLSD